MPWKKLLKRLMPIACLSFALLAGRGPTAMGQASTHDLSSLFDPGYILVDSNSDSLSDVVNVRLVLEDLPSEAAIIGAANIAARLGYETTAMDLNLAMRVTELPERLEQPAIFVGGRTAGGAGALAPGQGIIRWMGESDRFPHGSVEISGYDASGLLGITDYFSARYPALADPAGATLKDQRQRVADVLEEAEITGQPRVVALTTQRNRSGLSRVDIRIALKNDAALQKLQARLARTSESGKTAAQRLLEDGVYGMKLILQAPGSSKTVRIISGETQPASAAAEPKKNGDPDFDLPEFYGISGLYKDTNKDKVPDDMSGYLAYSGHRSPGEMVAWAARIGLESAGVRLPLVRPAGGLEHPEQAGYPVLIGSRQENENIQALREDGKLHELPESSGEGVVEFVSEAFDGKNGLVVDAGDADGLDAAMGYMARRFPYLWDYGKGQVELSEVQTDVRRFFQGVSGAGQVAAGLEKLDVWLERIKKETPGHVEVELAAKEAPEGLQEFVLNRVRQQLPDADSRVDVYQTGFGTGQKVFDEQFDIPWEVDDFWKQFHAELLPRIDAGSKGLIRVRLSESEAIRKQVRDKILDELEQKGVPGGAVEVQVLNAYKQGFSWVNDVVIPQLKRRKRVDHVNITYYNLRDSGEIRWQATDSDTRWLQELFPVDAVLARELGIPDSAISFTDTYTKQPVYRLEAFDRSGQPVFEDTFNPKYVVRPFFDLFPQYDSVRVTTGWMEADINGKKVVDRRIKTDIERFWDHFQQQTYQKILEYVMDIQDGLPEQDLAPYFDELRVNVTLSEPNEQLGILKEHIAPMEALHEDIYFETLLLFRLIGNRYGAGALSYPGRILPYMQPPVDGKPGKAHISFTGKKKGRPELRLSYRNQKGEPVVMRYELPNLSTEDPRFRAVRLRKGLEGLQSALFELPVDKADNPYMKLKRRGSESYIDRTFTSAERLQGMVASLRTLHESGLFEKELSYDRIQKLRFRFSMEDSAEFSQIVELPQSEHPQATHRKPLIDAGFSYHGQNLVQWQRPIPPDENNAIMARLNTFDNINVYYEASSMLGHDVYAMDLLPSTPSRYISQAKLNALKPTLFISGRQHANEFSSTSHILKLAEKVATDPEYQKYLQKMNLVLHPITNPDGADLAVDLHNLNEYYMDHAGYLGPLGVDITRDQDKRDPRYEVAKVRREIGETWLPDIYINMHGYPPHEWVQYFAGYSAWMHSRERGPRSNNYWIPRGYFLTGFSWYDHEDFPNSKALSFALLDSISSHVNAVPEMRRVNREMQMRYRKYRSGEEAYGEYYRNGIWVNAPLRGREETRKGFNNPRVTYFSLVSEAPDEPAQGDWMKMNAEAGVAHSTAALNYLYYGVNHVKREVREEGGRILRQEFREKPVLPREIMKEDDSAKASSGDE